MNLAGSRKHGSLVQALHAHLRGIRACLAGWRAPRPGAGSHALLTANAGSAGHYVVVFDPLDGSSNIDAGISVGSIFGIYAPSEDCSVGVSMPCPAVVMPVVSCMAAAAAQHAVSIA